VPCNQKASSPPSPIFTINTINLAVVIDSCPSASRSFCYDLSTKLRQPRDFSTHLPSISVLSLPETKQKHLKQASYRTGARANSQSGR
jgi:hypothetical protein